MQNQPPQHPTQYYAPYDIKNDEINLGDLWLILLERKRLIFLVMAAFLLIATAYLIVTPNIYRTVVTTLPPSQADIQALNTPGIRTFTPDQLYEDFLTQVGSITVQNQAFRELQTNGLNSSLSEEEKDRLFNFLAGKIDIIFPKKNDNEARVSATELQLDFSSPELTEAFLNKTVEKAESAALNTAFTLLQQHIDRRLTQIPLEIEALILSEKTKRQNQIIKLEEEVATKKAALYQQIKALRNKLEEEKQAKIAYLEERDRIAREALIAKIEALRLKAKTQRLNEISRLEQADQIKRSTIMNHITILRENAKNKRLDQIQILKEAANIARKLGILERAPLAKIPTPDNTSSMVYTEIKTSVSDIPLYLNGERALLAEIEELESRSSDDPFITELRPLLDQLAQLESNETIAILKNRTNDDPFIKELPDLLNQLALLENNAEIEALKARTNNDPFSPELLEYNRQLKLLDEEPAHLRALKNRQNDLAFVDNIGALQDEQHRLKLIKLEPQQAKAAIIDREAYTADAPIQPKRFLTLTIALIAGLIIGIFTALLVHSVSSATSTSKRAAS